MNEYRRVLQRNTRICALALLAFAATNLAALNRTRPQGNDFTVGVVHGIQIGLAAALLGFLLFLVVRNWRATRDESLARRFFIEDTDERLQLIRTRSGQLPLTIMLCASAAATVIAAYFNTTVFATLLFVCAGIVTLQGGLKLYYQSRY